ncbi:hypothetical protein [Microbacterium sp. Ld4]|uniref:hypothetical protein n=1 Tax=Microbacterium sp. Ld4 TaxID=649157 RepID=UPI00386863D1
MDTQPASRHESDDDRPSDTQDASDSLSTPDLRPAAPVRRYGGSAPVAFDPTAPLERAARNTPAPAPVVVAVGGFRSMLIGRFRSGWGGRDR